jgi:hypothetical protein
MWQQARCSRSTNAREASGESTVAQASLYTSGSLGELPLMV